MPPVFYYIDLESVKGGRLLDDKIVEAENAPSRAQRLLMPNDIIFQTVRPYQQNNYFYATERDLPTIASTGYAVIRTKQDPKFVYSLIHTQRFLTPVMQRCTGSSYPAVTGTDLEDIPTWMPCLEEQKRIGALLDLIGKKIDAQTKIIETLKKYKRGVSNIIFAEADNWEKSPFLEIFSTVSDKPYQVTTSEYFDSGSYEVVDQGKNDIVGYNSDASKVFNSVPIIVYGDHTTIIKYRNSPFIVGGDGVKLLTTHTQNDLQYLYYALCQYNIQPEGYKRHFSIVKSLYIPIPSLEQQHIIAQTLATIDLKINKEADILEQLLLQKKALLQQLFI